MPFDDLTRFLQSASDHGELLRIGEAVASLSEVAAITELIGIQETQRSPVLLFESVGDSTIPVVTNLLGGRNRFLRCLGSDDVAVAADRVHQLCSPYAAAMANVPEAGPWERIGGIAPRIARRGACQHVVKLGGDFDLRQLPSLPSQGNGGTPVLMDSAVLYRNQRNSLQLDRAHLRILSENRIELSGAAARTVIKAAAEVCAAEKRQLAMAVVIGGDPLLNYVAGFPLPDGLEPFRFLGGLRGEPINLIRCRGVELDVPADAEIVLEGVIESDPETASLKGPEINSGCSLILSVTAMTHRANPLLPLRIPSPRYDESFVWRELTERLALNWLRTWHPSVADIHLPRLGFHQQLAFVRMTSTSKQERDSLAHTLLGLPPLSGTSLFVLVGANVPFGTDDGAEQALVQGIADGTAVSLATSLQDGRRRFVIDATAATIGPFADEDPGKTSRRWEILRKAGWSGP